ncbi:MAG: hypothetical protein QHJ73_01260 [Armatimonadota bacterium]|nr:hypothetical protein [Armatimonadota bacterium]
MVRLVRTLSSEVYTLWEDETRVGQFDVHYARGMVHGTLILEVNLSVSSEEQLLAQIDQEVVASHEPNLDRSDFLVTVFRGEEIRSYADPLHAEDDDDDE